VRAVLDPNVLISALLSATGAPAKVLRAWVDGEFELLASPLLFAELQRALAYPKLRERIEAAEAKQLVDWLRREATVLADPEGAPSLRSNDPGDDYLLALAEEAGVPLVSGDGDLLAFSDELPIFSPQGFLDSQT
jgi:uncharacterized protein